LTEGIIKVVKGTRTDTETRFHVGHGNAFPCWHVLCELCTQKLNAVHGHRNVFPCRTQKCVSVSVRVLCEICTQKHNAIKSMDTETCFRVGHGIVFPCRDMYFVSYSLKKSVKSKGWTRKRVSVSDKEICFRVRMSKLRCRSESAGCCGVNPDIGDCRGGDRP